MSSQADKERICDSRQLANFIAGRLDDDERLDFLMHLDECPYCWEGVYNATKATHPHFYKKARRKIKVTKKDLKPRSEESGVYEFA